MVYIQHTHRMVPTLCQCPDIPLWEMHTWTRFRFRSRTVPHTVLSHFEGLVATRIMGGPCGVWFIYIGVTLEVHLSRRSPSAFQSKFGDDVHNCDCSLSTNYDRPRHIRIRYLPN
jgi:hypothetical protein